MALRQIMTPNGPLLLSDEDAAAFGFAPEAPPVSFGAPALPPPPEEPVPDVAFNPPPMAPDAVSGAGAVMPGMAPRLTPGLADSGLVPQQAVDGAPAAAQPDPRAYRGGGTGGLDTPGASAQAGASGAPASEQEPAPAQRAPVDLRATSWSDIADRQMADVDAEAAATTRLGESEATALAAKADAMEKRDIALAQRQQESEAAAQLEQAEIAKRAQAWENKQAEWMNAKVVRRGFNAAEIIGAVVAGFGSAMKGQGDRNPALEMAMAKIQTNVDDQIRERDEMGRHVSALKGSVDYAREIAKDNNSMRNAAIGFDADRMGREIETVAAKMAPGIKRDEVALLATGLRQKGTALLVGSKQHEDSIQQAELARAQSDRESRRQAGQAAARLKEDARQFDASDKRVRDLAQMETDKEINKAIAAGDVERAKLLAANAKEERELGIGGGPMLKGGKSPNAAIAAMNKLSDTVGAGSKVASPGFDELGRLLQPDGTVFKAPDLVSAQALRKQVKAAITSSEMIDEVLRLRAKHGWSSDLFKSDEWRAMQANKGAIIVEAKNAAELGALSGPDMDLIVSMMGTQDPTELRDPAAGLAQMKKNMQQSTRNALTTAGYAGEAFNVPDASSDPKADKDVDIANLTGKGGFYGQKKDGPGFERVMNRDQELSLGDLKKRASVLRGADGKANPDAKLAVDGLLEAANQGLNQKARDEAAKALVELALDKNPWAMLRVDEFKDSLPSRRRKQEQGK